MPIFTPAETPPTPTLYLALYRPWSWHKAAGGDSSNYDRHSARILDFKDGRPDAIEEFAGKIDSILGSDFAITVIPSHDPAKKFGPLHTLAGLLSGKNARTDASPCLVRHKLISKLATGGDRAVQVHFDSIRVEQAELLHGKAVLILDDVTTSGGSMNACMELVRGARATGEIRGLCLGKTA